MGSLILLLLVIDRRAKAIARAKAIQAAEQAGADDARALAAARAEFERRRAALHESLCRQEQELTAAIDKAKAEETAKSKELLSQEARRQESEARLEAELMQLRQEQLDLEKHKADVTRKEQDAQPHKKELTELTRELLVLEQTLAGLKQARQHDHQHYSVVPYRGRFGETRKPLYLECRAGSLVFHQGGPVLEGVTLTQAEIRSEVKRHSQPGVVDSPTQSTLYLLLLIRPDGIGTYYRTMAALEGMPIEYGYELVDTDWVLDFPDSRNVRDQASLAADVSNRNSSGNRVASLLKTGPGFGRPQTGSSDRAAGGLDESRGLADNASSGNAESRRGARDGFPGRGDPNRFLTRGNGSSSEPFAAGQAGPGGVWPIGASASRSESLIQNQPNLPLGVAPGSPGTGNVTAHDNFDRGNGPGVSGQASDARSNGLNGLASAGAPSGLQTPPGSVSKGTSPGAASAPPFATPVGRDTKVFGLGVTGSGLSEPVLASGQPETGSDSRTRGTRKQGNDAALVENGTSPLPSPTGYTQSASGPGSLSASELVQSGEAARGPLATPLGSGTSPAPSPLRYAQSAGGTGSGSAPEAGQPGGAVGPPAATVGSGTSSTSSTLSYSQAPEGTRPASAGSAPALLAGALPAERAAAAQSSGGGPTSGAPGEANQTSGNPPVPGQGPPSDGATDSRAFQDHALPPTPDAFGRGARNQLPPRQTIRRYANLDWVISVECTADALLLSPAGMRIPTAALRTAGAENPLAGAVRELIGRRQASVPAGEPAYRPRIRFLVRPDGLRSYYEACTALEPLQLPMTRENVRRPAEKKTEAFNR
jgi:hypothetical protein